MPSLSDDVQVTGEELKAVRKGAYLGPKYYNSHVGQWLLTLLNQRMAKQEKHSLDVYEFGVFTGNRMRELASQKGLKNFGHMWGFDSFTGYPDETPGIWVPHRTWKSGGLSASDAMSMHNTTLLFDALRTFIGCAYVCSVKGGNAARICHPS